MPSTTVIKWPLEISDSGSFVMAQTDDEAWNYRVKALLCTRIGERVMRSNYGCALPSRLFDNIQPTSPEEDIRAAIAKWLPLLTVDEVSIVEDYYIRPSGLRDKVLMVSVTYTTPSKQQSIASLSITSKESL